MVLLCALPCKDLEIAAHRLVVTNYVRTLLEAWFEGDVFVSVNVEGD